MRDPCGSVAVEQFAHAADVILGQGAGGQVHVGDVGALEGQQFAGLSAPPLPRDARDPHRRDSRAAKPSAPASFGLRRHQRHARSARLTRRARIGSFARNRPSSSAKSCALAYRRRGSFSRHLRQIVSRSRGMLGLNSRGATGSVSTTCRSSAVNVSPWNGGRPGQQVVQHGSERIHIAGDAHGAALAFRLLGREVTGRAEHLAAEGEGGVES